VKRSLHASVLALTTVLAISACSGGGAAGSDAGSKSGPLQISLLTTYNGLPFYTAMQCGAQDAAKEMGGNITVTADGPSHGMNVADQIPVLEGVVNRHPSGIIFVPADPVAMVAPITSAMSAGIPVVTTDATLSKQTALAQFHGDNKAGGVLAAQEMIKKTGGKNGKILVLDARPGLPVTNERAQGFIDAMKASGSNLEILGTQYYEDDPTKAATIIQSSLQAHPDIVGVFATSESGAMGTVSGLQGVANASAITVVAYDAGPTLVKALRDGKLDALVAQGSYQQGYEALKALVGNIRGTSAAKPPFDNVVDNALVTAQNVDDPKIAKMLYPDSCK